MEIPFGAKDSELIESTYHIPYGMEAIIEGDKVIIRKKESADDRIREAIINLVLKVMGREKDNLNDENYDKMLDWLEKQSKENMIEALRLEYEKGKADALQEQRKEWNKEDEKIRGAIIDHLKDYNLTEWADWLEKKWNDSYLQEKIENFTNVHKGEDPDNIIAACRGGEKKKELKKTAIHKWENGDIVRLKKDNGTRWQIGKSNDPNFLDEWFISEIRESGIAGGYVSTYILDNDYEFVNNPINDAQKEIDKKFDKLRKTASKDCSNVGNRVEWIKSIKERLGGKELKGE